MPQFPPNPPPAEATVILLKIKFTEPHIKMEEVTIEDVTGKDEDTPPWQKCS